MKRRTVTSIVVLLSMLTLVTVRMDGGWWPTDAQLPRDPSAAKRGPLRFQRFAELLPRTPDERAIAEALDRGNEPLEGRGAIGIMVPVESAPPPPPSAHGHRDPDWVLRAAVCRADAIYVGRVQEERVILSKQGTWLLTIYAVDVLRKVIGTVPLLEKGRAAVAVQSGMAEIAGQRVSTIHTPLLQAPRDYLFFVTAVPNSAVQVSWSSTTEVSWPAHETLERHMDKITTLSRNCASK